MSVTSTAREARRVAAPAGGEIYGDEGNELTPLWRRSWLCEGCIKAIIEAWCGDKGLKVSRGSRR